MTTMKINIAINYSTLKLDVLDSMTIGQLKIEICDKWPIADNKPNIEMLSLLFSGKKLLDSQTLSDIKIKENQKITVMLNVMAAKIQHIATKAQENKQSQVAITKQSAQEILNEPPTKILPHLFHSNVNQVIHEDFKNLKSEGITHIISLTEDKIYDAPAFISKVLHISIPDEDAMNIAAHFQQTFDFIEDAKRENGKVLVHCHAGMSRSITIVAAYLIKEFKWSAEKALQEIAQKKGAHAIIQPNNGFVKQLHEYAVKQ